MSALATLTKPPLVLKVLDDLSLITLNYNILLDWPSHKGSMDG